MRYRFHVLLLCVLSVFFSNTAVASHIVGGELTYSCLSNNTYRINLTIYQDCLSGFEGALREDDPAYIGVFNLDNSAVMFNSEVKSSSSGLVPANIPSICVNNYPPSCLNKLTFQQDVVLPYNTKGYRIVYVRCCRNAAIVNIQSPGNTGVTYFADIMPSLNPANCNSSPVFSELPPQIICINNPLVYNHSAKDPDGDSLSYELCETYQGGDPTSEKDPPSLNIKPPVKYLGAYSAKRPMAGSPIVQINPVTGIITGTPNILGRFVVTVCCSEWRGGVKINTIRRDFQFVVANCSKAVTANIPELSDEANTYIIECTGNTVKFLNTSEGAFSYNWDFGSNGATSTDKEPTYTYPDTGVYSVRLVINEGSQCVDSIRKTVKIFPEYNTDFESAGLLCPMTPIQFTDKSFATYPPIAAWKWNFGDGGLSEEENPQHTYLQGGNYNVVLVSKSIKGCTDSVVKTLNVDNFKPFAGNDTIIVKGEYINFNARGGDEYLWTPSTRLNFANLAAPQGFYPDTGWYNYNVYVKSAAGCEGNDSIKVWVVDQETLFMPSAFTPNGDGLNDYLRPIGVGYREVKFFRVFNRFGQLVFDSNNFKDGWDGRFNGQYMDLGVYYWVLSVTDRFGAPKMLKGDATLIR